MLSAPLLVHAANACFLLAYLVRDILKLRVLTLFAGFFLLAFHLTFQPPAWGFVAWQVLFSGIQVVQVKRLMDERRPVPLSRDERLVRELCFSKLSAREVKQLCAVARFERHPPETRLVVRGEKPDALYLVLEGGVRVETAGQHVTSLGPGAFVGELCFLSGTVPGADALTSDDTAVASFDADGLRELMAARPELRAAIQSSLTRDLAHKLRGEGPPSSRRSETRGHPAKDDLASSS